MRIFFVTNNYTPYSGGVISSIAAISDALRAQGHEVFIVTLNFLGDQHHDPDYVIRVHCPIRFLYKKNHMAIPWRPTHTMKQLIKEYKPDVVHVHHPFLLGVSALHAARIYNIPCVFTYHTMYEEYAHYVPLLGNHVKPLIRLLVKNFCNKVDGIIAPSSAVKAYIKQQKTTAPITVIPSPLRPLFFTPATHAVTTYTKKYHELLLVSRFVPEKNIPFVFDLFKLLPNTIKLTLVGYGTDYDAIQKHAFETLQLPQDRVCFIHKPIPEELLTIYRTADLFIFPSQTDTQGLVLAESMSQGVPVIALDGPGQRDIIQNNINGFIVNNVQDAATAIMNVLENTEKHTQLIAGARATAAHYNSNHIINQLLAFYQKTSS